MRKDKIIIGFLFAAFIMSFFLMFHKRPVQVRQALPSPPSEATQPK